MGLEFSSIHNTFLTIESKKKKNDSSSDTAVTNPSGRLSSIYFLCPFLNCSFSSSDAVLTCTFLGIFCLNPHL